MSDFSKYQADRYELLLELINNLEREPFMIVYETLKEVEENKELNFHNNKTLRLDEFLKKRAKQKIYESYFGEEK